MTNSKTDQKDILSSSTDTSKTCTTKEVKQLLTSPVAHIEAHLKLVESYETQGSLIIGGSFFPNDGATLFFQAQDETIPDSFIKSDPYYKNGLVKDYEIKEIEIVTKKKMDELALYYKYR